MKLRYIAVGGTNTAIDFGVLFLLHWFGMPATAANIVSTTSAFCFSFFANKKYTFKTTDSNVKRELVLFVVVTLFGLWVLQGIVILGIHPLLTSFHLSEDVLLLVSKLLASIVTLVWNYLMYSRVVFKAHTDKL